ncbi:MAG: GNAT family N-acetyltransferase [Cyclonatronaceae bacterium]
MNTEKKHSSSNSKFDRFQKQFEGNFSLREARWPDDIALLMHVRNKVFVEEQFVPYHDEIDEQDPRSYHLLVTDKNNRPVATGRLTPEGHIGRMAVLKEYRGHKIGHRLMLHLMQKAMQRGHRIIELSAQTHAIPFYQKYGFSPVGRVYDEVGIPHQKMIFINKKRR